MDNSEQLTNNRMLKLLKKYGIILLILDFSTRFGVIQILRLYQKTFPLVENSDFTSINNIVIGLTTLALNLIAAIILLKDLDRRKSLSWILLVICLLNPWTSVVFFLIWQTVEMKNLPITNGG